MENIIIAHSSKDFDRLMAKAEILRLQLSVQLAHFEADFESDEGRFNYERMRDYLDAAIFMRDNFQRPDYYNYIERVEEVMGDLPI